MDEPVRLTLTDAAEFLTARSVPFAVIGGIAVGVHGEPRFTADVDVVVGIDIDRALELLESVTNSAFEPLVSDAAEIVRSSFILPLRHRRTRIRVDLAVGMTGFERQLIARAREVDFGGVEIPVTTAEDLLVMKVLASRPRDTDDARQIAIRHGTRLDWDYVLDVGRQLEEAIGQDLEPQLLALKRDATETE